MFALPPHVTASLDSRSKFKSEVLPQVPPVQPSLNSQSGGCQLSYSLVSVALTRSSVTCTPTLCHTQWQLMRVPSSSSQMESPFEFSVGKCVVEHSRQQNADEVLIG